MGTKHKKTKRQVKKVDKTLVVLYFIEQKVWEIAGFMVALMITFLLGQLDPFKLNIFPKEQVVTFWTILITGIFTILSIICAILIIFIIAMLAYSICQANWQWAEKRAKRARK